MLLMAQTVAPVTGGRGLRGAGTALEPCNCNADSSELLTTHTVCDNEAGQEWKRYQIMS